MSILINGKNIIDEDNFSEKPKFSRTTFVKNTVISIYLFIKQFFYVPLWSNNKIDENIKDSLPDEEESDENALLKSTTNEDVVEDDEDEEDEEFVIFC